MWGEPPSPFLPYARPTARSSTAALSISPRAGFLIPGSTEALLAVAGPTEHGTGHISQESRLIWQVAGSHRHVAYMGILDHERGTVKLLQWGIRDAQQGLGGEQWCVVLLQGPMNIATWRTCYNWMLSSIASSATLLYLWPKA